MIFVDGIGNAALEGNGGELRSARQSHFDVARTVGFQEWQLVPGERSDLAQLPGDDACNAADGSRAFITGVPITSNGVAEVETFDGVGEVAHEIAAAEFAVGEDVKAKFFLLREDAEDMVVFESAKFLGAARSLPGLKQIRGPQETAYLVSAKDVRHDRLVLSPKLEPASGSMTVPKVAGPRLSLLEMRAAKS